VTAVEGVVALGLGVTASAVQQRDFLELEDLDDAVSCYNTVDMLLHS
jgi:hypothetical protein